MTDEPSINKIAFVLYPGLTPLDMIGPLQVMSTLHLVAPQWRPVVVGERVEAMSTDAGPQIVPQATFEDEPNPSIVIVPGGGAPTVKQMGNPILRDYLLQVTENADVVGSVCTGALILAAAGLLEGRRATTHWAYNTLLERLGASYVPKRWVRDGKFMTAAGVAAGIDMALELVSQLTDEETARFVQLGIEYDPQPPLGEIAWDTVDRDMFLPVIEEQVQRQLSDTPDLQSRLLSIKG